LLVICLVILLMQSRPKLSRANNESSSYSPCKHCGKSFKCHMMPTNHIG
jgi:hypothetical protein